jgi:hypothetical protein
MRFSARDGHFPSGTLRARLLEPNDLANVTAAPAWAHFRRYETRSSRMNKLMIMSVVIAAAGATATLAQTMMPKSGAGSERSQADCQANWKTADRNNDGRLDKAEIAAAKAAIPTTLASRTSISQTDFMRACGISVQGQKK